MNEQTIGHVSPARGFIPEVAESNARRNFDNRNDRDRALVMGVAGRLMAAYIQTGPTWVTPGAREEVAANCVHLAKAMLREASK